MWTPNARNKIDRLAWHDYQKARFYIEDLNKLSKSTLCAVLFLSRSTLSIYNSCLHDVKLCFDSFLTLLIEKNNYTTRNSCSKQQTYKVKWNIWKSFVTFSFSFFFFFSFLFLFLEKSKIVRFATVPYQNIYFFKNKPTPPHKINFHTIIIKNLLQNFITQRKKIQRTHLHKVHLPNRTLLKSTEWKPK